MNDSPVDTEQEPATAMRELIQRIATGPEMSKDLSLDEARLGMQLILDGTVDAVQAAVFLIALRMKRETDDENKGVLDAVRWATGFATATVDEIVDVADPYDGFNRTLPASPFLPAVLAACGVPAVSHGLETVGPKYGVTHRQVLRAAGVPVDLPAETAAARVSDPNIGWAYVDQRIFCPPLHDLVNLRTQIVKRPALTTVEVLARPVHGRTKTHLLTGYVHKAYPRIYALLARHAGFDSAILVRGVEGGVIPSLRQPGKVWSYHDRGEEQAQDVDPADLGIRQSQRAVALPENLPPAEDQRDGIGMTVDSNAVADAAAGAGRDALGGAHGPTRDSLVYTTAICLAHLGRCPTLTKASDAAREALDSGRALASFRAGAIPG